MYEAWKETWKLGLFTDEINRNDLWGNTCIGPPIQTLKSTVLNILKGNQENNVCAIKKQIMKRNQTNSEADKYSNQNEKCTARFQYQADLRMEKN